jgi:DNA-binding Lrp family transcriptional regulator
MAEPCHELTYVQDLNPQNRIRVEASVIPLDRIDLAILVALQNDARMSNKELAAEIGLAPSSTLGRVRRLKDSGVLRGAHAEVDPAALGIGLQALMALRLRTNTRDSFDSARGGRAVARRRRGRPARAPGGARQPPPLRRDHGPRLLEVRGRAGADRDRVRSSAQAGTPFVPLTSSRP